MIQELSFTYILWHHSIYVPLLKLAMSNLKIVARTAGCASQF